MYIIFFYFINYSIIYILALFFFILNLIKLILIFDSYFSVFIIIIFYKIFRLIWRKQTSLCRVGDFKSQGERITRESWQESHDKWFVRRPGQRYAKEIGPQCPSPRPILSTDSSDSFKVSSLLVTRRIGTVNEYGITKKCRLRLESNFWHYPQFKIAWHLMATNINCESFASSITTALDICFSANSLFGTSRWSSLLYRTIDS